jgi:hypothetical protein
MRSHALPSERMGEPTKPLVESIHLKEAARRGNLELFRPGTDPSPFAPLMRAESLLPLPHAHGPWA